MGIITKKTVVAIELQHKDYGEELNQEFIIALQHSLADLLNRSGGQIVKCLLNPKVEVLEKQEVIVLSTEGTRHLATFSLAEVQTLAKETIIVEKY